MSLEKVLLAQTKGLDSDSTKTMGLEEEFDLLKQGDEIHIKHSIGAYTRNSTCDHA